MNNLPIIEEFYQKYIKDLHNWTPDGVIDVNIELLQRMDLLDFSLEKNQEQDPEIITRYFHVTESIEKITLINEEYVIWIVPDSNRGISVTYTLVALNQPDVGPQLEVVFTTRGVYNNSWLVLHVLEKFLLEIHENESLISYYSKSA